jgi:hypothetical protein
MRQRDRDNEREEYTEKQKELNSGTEPVRETHRVIKIHREQLYTE